MILQPLIGKETTVGLVSGTSPYTKPPTRSLILLPEYRSVIFYHSPAQKDIAERVTDEVQKKHFDPHGQKIVTEILEAGQWSKAEEYHQLYLSKNPTGYHCYTHKLHW